MKRRLKPARKRYAVTRRPSLQPVDRRSWRRDAEPDPNPSICESTPVPRRRDDRLAS